MHGLRPIISGSIPHGATTICRIRTSGPTPPDSPSATIMATLPSAAFSMVLAEKPLSVNRGRPSPRYTQRIQTAALTHGAQLQHGLLYARIVWFQRQRTEGDVDNIAKLILDSLKGVVL